MKGHLQRIENKRSRFFWTIFCLYRSIRLVQNSDYLSLLKAWRITFENWTSNLLISRESWYPARNFLSTPFLSTLQDTTPFRYLCPDINTKIRLVPRHRSDAVIKNIMPHCNSVLHAPPHYYMLLVITPWNLINPPGSRLIPASFTCTWNRIEPRKAKGKRNETGSREISKERGSSRAPPSPSPSR